MCHVLYTMQSILYINYIRYTTVTRHLGSATEGAGVRARVPRPLQQVMIKVMSKVITEVTQRVIVKTRLSRVMSRSATPEDAGV